MVIFHIFIETFMPFNELIQALSQPPVAPPEKYTLGKPLFFVNYLDGTLPTEPAVACLQLIDGHLKAYAAMRDSVIRNDATHDNDHTWETGDAFEFFFQPRYREDYYEAHVTPEQIRLQLHLQDYRTFRGVPHEQKICDIGLSAKTQIFRDRNLWLAEMDIPCAAMGMAVEHVIGSKFVFSRYNYDFDGSKPAITSTQIFPKTAHFPPLWHVIA